MEQEQLLNTLARERMKDEEVIEGLSLDRTRRDISLAPSILIRKFHLRLN